MTPPASMKPLPRGRHNLSREEVAESQRLRLVRAMAEVMAKKGYAATSVADILRRARVSRESFYELFADKEACFVSAFDAAYGHLLEAVAASQGSGEEAPRAGASALGAVLENYLAAITSDPAAARVFLIEVYAAGPKALGRRLELQRGLVDALAAALGASTKEDRFAVEALVAATVSMVTARLALGDVDGVRALHAPLMALAGQLGFG